MSGLTNGNNSASILLDEQEINNNNEIIITGLDSGYDIYEIDFIDLINDDRNSPNVFMQIQFFCDGAWRDANRGQNFSCKGYKLESNDGSSITFEMGDNESHVTHMNMRLIKPSVDNLLCLLDIKMIGGNHVCSILHQIINFSHPYNNPEALKINVYQNTISGKFKLYGIR